MLSDNEMVNAYISLKKEINKNVHIENLLTDRGFNTRELSKNLISINCTPKLFKEVFLVDVIKSGEHWICMSSPIIPEYLIDYVENVILPEPVKRFT